MAKRKKQELELTVHTQIGDTVYDLTNKIYEQFPDEVKTALEPAQRLVAKIQIDSVEKRFYDSLPPDLQIAYRCAPIEFKRHLLAKLLDVHLDEEEKS